MSAKLLISGERYMTQHADMADFLSRQGDTVIGAFDFQTLAEDAAESYQNCLTEVIIPQHEITSVYFHNVADHKAGIAGHVWEYASNLRLDLGKISLFCNTSLISTSPIAPKASLGIGLASLRMDDSFMAIRGGVIDDSHLWEGID